jgi:phytoene dehydrogenase-like protein
VRTRRHFLSVVLAGGAAAGCRPSGATAPPSAPPRRIAGESFTTCHALRDGAALPTAAPTAEHEVVIVGGGPSGLVAAHRLQDRDVLLLEKEPRLGGNCTLDAWEGVTMSTGAAFYSESERELAAFLAELGAVGSPVVGHDALVIDGQPTLDFLRDGAARLPLPTAVRDDFRRSRDDLLRQLETRDERELDARPFAELLAPYAPEVRRFWDRFGRSNWGADAAGTSAAVGCEAYLWAGGGDDPRLSYPGGLAGAAARLGGRVTAALGDRVVCGAAVHRIEVDGARAVVHWLADGAPRSVRARVVIVAAPKYVARRIVAGLPAAQAGAMAQARYLPFPVFNVCLRAAGPQPAYDNWCLDTPFTDFVVADWVAHGGPGPAARRTALTVYHPLAEAERDLQLAPARLLELADGLADGLERHFPGTLDRIAEIRVFRRGHAMAAAAPGRRAWTELATAPFGPVLFAHTDTAAIASFAGALAAAEQQVARARDLLR